MPITLSYIITTRNHLSSLRLLLDDLTSGLSPGEEVVVIDAGSSDGTQAYLADLAARHRIHRWISEPDRGESHGFNKALLWSTGDFVKILTDDDVFDWHVIRQCARFMAAHPGVDALGGNIGSVCTTDEDPISFARLNEQAYLTYWRGERPRTSFCGIALMLRRTSLPLIGMFHTGCHAVDHEYTLRITELGTIAWCTKPVAVHIENARSKLQTSAPSRALVTERQRLDTFYDYHPDPPPKQPGILARLRGQRAAGNWYQVDPSTLPEHLPERPEPVPFDLRYEQARIWLTEQNAANEIEFLVPIGKRYSLPSCDRARAGAEEASA